MPSFTTTALAQLLSLSLSWATLSLDPGSARPLGCDGDPPKLVNHDSREYSFKVECGKKSESGRIATGETLSLKDKSGCLLVLGEQSVSLYVELVCVIQKGKLSCEVI